MIKFNHFLKLTLFLVLKTQISKSESEQGPRNDCEEALKDSFVAFLFIKVILSVIISKASYSFLVEHLPSINNFMIKPPLPFLQLIRHFCI